VSATNLPKYDRKQNVDMRNDWRTDSQLKHPPSAAAPNRSTSSMTSPREVGWRHESLGAAAVGTEYFGAVGEEAATDKRRVAAIADETFAVPVALVERNELCSAQSCVTHRHNK